MTIRQFEIARRALTALANGLDIIAATTQRIANRVAWWGRPEGVE